MTQRDQIHNFLKDGQWVCGTSFQRAYVPEYRTRINELRKAGHGIEASRCDLHTHKGVMQKWRLVMTFPVQLKRRKEPLIPTCCYSSIAFSDRNGPIHDKDCEVIKKEAVPSLF